MSDQQDLDFSLLLASSVHDIKNSLGMLLSSLDEAIDFAGAESPDQRKRYSVLRGEASRINNALIYLLGLYRIQHNQLTINLNEIFVRDFLEEQIASQQLLLDVNAIQATVDCDDSLTGFFDEQLVAGIISNIVVNAAKYTRNELILSATQRDGYLEISVLDNGSGYPQKIIDNIDNGNRGINFNSGSTNLGLFFAQQIARFHVCKGRRGYIELCNRESGGGCFRLFLP